MKRKYGKPPFNVIVVHGGPGAPGSARPLAEELSKTHAISEPLQTKNTVDGQIEELKQTIEQKAQLPVYLVGWSWGAWLSYLVAAKHPSLVRKLILVGSGPFEAKYAKNIMQTRLDRLSKEEKEKVEEIMVNLQKKETNSELFKEFGELMDKADTFNPITLIEKDSIPFEPEIYNGVWTEAAKLRQTGELLEIGRKIICPVIAIHGNYDPHPAEGVKKPLSKILQNFKFILLKKCGHKPWCEKEAKNKFFRILNKELE